MPSSPVAPEDADGKKTAIALKLRRQSVELGLTLQDGAAPGQNTPKMSTLGMKDLTTNQIANIADNFHPAHQGEQWRPTRYRHLGHC